MTIFLNNKELSLISCYCPTYSYPRFDKTKLDNLIKSIPHPFILAGDFNAHNTSWGCNSTSRRGREILDVINDNCLVLLNDGQVTTVGSSSWRPNALDLTIVSPELAMSCEWSVHNDPLGSYHLPVLIKFHLTTATDIHNTLHTTLPVYPNYKCVDWNSYKNRVDVGLQKINFSQYSSLESYDIFCKLLVDSAQACSGVSRSKQNISSRKGRIPRPRLPWWNLKCFDAVVKSKEAYVKFKNCPSQENYINFKKQQAFKKLTLKIEKHNSWVRLCESFNRSTPLSLIWKHMRKFGKIYNSKGEQDGWVLEFLEKYSSVYQNQLQIENVLSINNNSFLCDSFTLQELKSAIASRKDTAFGFDGIPYILFKNLSDSALRKILLILNELWLNIEIPTDWKIDILVPVLKPQKPKYNANSYRPITLTSCVGKLFEQLLKQRLEFFVEKYNLISDNQYGFRKGKSAHESFCQLHLDICNSVVNRDCLVAVFFDISGAFNSVDIDVLFKELCGLGVPVKIVNWVHNFLLNRKVYAKYNGKIYGPMSSSTGVCQGGILSPLLFLLYIHRLNEILGTNIKNLQFADDLVIYASGKNIQQMIADINLALTKLHEYFSYLKLEVNAAKSKVLVFGKHSSIPPVVYNNLPLVLSLEAKFLGVLFTTSLSWNQYVELIIARANRALNILKSLSKISWGADPKILLMLYKSLVRSHFEYGFLCFGSVHKLVDKLDKIQNNALRLITGAFKTTPINAMQLECNLPPIKIRLEHLKERFILKIYTNKNNTLLNYLSSASSTFFNKCPFVLENISGFLQFLHDAHIQRNESHFPCYQGEFESKYPDINIVIDSELHRKEQVYEKKILGEIIDSFIQMGLKMIYAHLLLFMIVS